MWFNRRRHLQRPRTPPLFDISNGRTRPLHPLPPETHLASPPYVTRQPPHRIEDSEDSSREPSPFALPPSSTALRCVQCAATFRPVGEGSESFVILRCGHGFDRHCLEAIARPPPRNRPCGMYRSPHPPMRHLNPPILLLTSGLSGAATRVRYAEPRRYRWCCPDSGCQRRYTTYVFSNSRLFIRRIGFLDANLEPMIVSSIPPVLRYS